MFTTNLIDVKNVTCRFKNFGSLETFERFWKFLILAIWKSSPLYCCASLLFFIVFVYHIFHCLVILYINMWFNCRPTLTLIHPSKSETNQQHGGWWGNVMEHFMIYSWVYQYQEWFKFSLKVTQPMGKALNWWRLRGIEK